MCPFLQSFDFMKKTFFIIYLFLQISSSSKAQFQIQNGTFFQKIPLLEDEGKDQFYLRYSSRTLWTSHLGFGWCAPWTIQLEIIDFEHYRLRKCDGDQAFSLKTEPTGQRLIFISSRGDELEIHSQGFWVYLKEGDLIRFNRRGLPIDRTYSSSLTQTRGISTEKTKTKKEKFIYDALFRLQEWVSPDHHLKFDYRGLSLQTQRIRMQNRNLATLSFDQNQLKSIQFQNRIQYFSYDDLQNMILIADPNSNYKKIKITYTEDDRALQIINNSPERKSASLEGAQ